MAPTSLPIDLIPLILSHISSSPSALLPLMLTSRTFCSFVAPLLYSKPFHVCHPKSYSRLVRLYVSYIPECNTPFPSLDRQPWWIEAGHFYDYPEYLQALSDELVSTACKAYLKDENYRTLNTRGDNYNNQNVSSVQFRLIRMLLHRSTQLRHLELRCPIQYLSNTPGDDIVEVAARTQKMLSTIIVWADDEKNNEIKLRKRVNNRDSMRNVPGSFFYFLAGDSKIASLVRSQLNLHRFVLHNCDIGCGGIMRSLLQRSSQLNEIEFYDCYFDDCDLNAWLRKYRGFRVDMSAGKDKESKEKKGANLSSCLSMRKINEGIQCGLCDK
ncbi:3588_t:CDS:1 [Paraglomus brasilianum]|uniref:3588_t:CDS:1 n=1 Tax=Paraglomus brasilianum TaxID=144538 RepID=A0A9N8ZXK3_9GLOM|nr:3588_t:CDS:1 [Paraglomus brasilianum]